MIRIIWLLAGTLILAQVGVQAQTKKAAPIAKLYESKCGSCHGKTGKGNPAMAKALKVELSVLDLTHANTLNKKDPELLEVIAKGKNKMPGFAKQLSADQQKALMEYVRKLAGEKSPLTPPTPEKGK